MGAVGIQPGLRDRGPGGEIGSVHIISRHGIVHSAHNAERKSASPGYQGCHGPTVQKLVGCPTEVKMRNLPGPRKLECMSNVGGVWTIVRVTVERIGLIV